MPRDTGCVHSRPGHAAARRRTRPLTFQYSSTAGARSRRDRAPALSVDRGGPRRMADIAVGIRARSAGEYPGPAVLSCPAGLSFLGDVDTRLAIDDTDHPRAGTTLGLSGTLSISVASQLCRGYRRDRRTASRP